MTDVLPDIGTTANAKGPSAHPIRALLYHVWRRARSQSSSSPPSSTSRRWSCRATPPPQFWANRRSVAH
jgi:hypothetical protein